MAVLRNAVRGRQAVVLLTVALAACTVSPATPSAAPTNSANPGPSTSTNPSGPAAPTPTALATPTPLVIPTPADLSARPLIWYAPLPNEPTNPGSVDFMDQFTPAAPWQHAASHVDVYKLYGGWVARGASDAQLATAIADIRRRGMVLAVEAGPLTAPADCGQAVESFAGVDEARVIASRVLKAGGRIAVIAFDEPYYYAHVYDGANACHWDLPRIASMVVDYVKVLRSYFPELIAGDIEPLPEPVTAAGLADWIDAYRAAAGEPLAFLHMDMDWGRPGWDTLGHAVASRAARRGVPVGMIYNGGSAPTAAQWLQQAGLRVKRYEAGGVADHTIFQSWNPQPDHVLPETDPAAFSSLVRVYVEDYASLGASTSGTDVALDGTPTASAALADAPPAGAFDGDFDTLWNSGDYAPQWVRVDFAAPSDVASVRLTVAQYPAGQTTHDLYGIDSNGKLTLLHEFSGSTSDGMTLDYAPPTPWSNLYGLRLRTTASPSWVAWREIEAFAP
jgi:hypothetical protein